MNMITSDPYALKLFGEPVPAADSEQRLATSREQFLIILSVCQRVTDFSTCAAVTFAAEFLELHIGGLGMYPIRTMLTVSVVVGVFVVGLSHQNRIASERAGLYPVYETARAVRISLQAVVFLLSVDVLLRPELPLRAIVLALVLMPLLLMLQKQVLASIIQGLHNRNYGTDRVVVYGAGKASPRITSALSSAPRLALRPVAFIDEDSGSVNDCSLELVYPSSTGDAVQYTSMTVDLLSSLYSDLLLIATLSISTEQRDRLKTIAKQVGARVERLSEASLVEEYLTECVEISGLSLIHEKKKVGTWSYTYGKRMVDIIVSSILLVLLSPVFLLIAVLIRLSSMVPLLVQKRVGRDRAFFKMYKFRSMCSMARKHQSSPKTSRDPRITRVGRFLRRTSLDELPPQLINVFLRQMSLVGSRPEMPFIVRRYNEHQRERLEMAPEITDLLQLSSDRAYPIHESLHYDLTYIRDRFLSMDRAILIHTLFFAMCRGV